jgi:hypothetical protein
MFSTFRFVIVLAGTVALLGLWPGGSALAATVDVVIETELLAGRSAALAFDLLDGDGTLSSAVTVGNFALPGGSLGGAAAIGGASGSLSAEVVLTDSEPFNEWLQYAELGASMRFSLEIASEFSGGPDGPADKFSFYLLNGDAASPGFLQPLFATNDPSGADALFSIILGADPVVENFAALMVPPEATWTAEVRTVPLPSGLSLFVPALALLARGLRRRSA